MIPLVEPGLDVGGFCCVGGEVQDEFLWDCGVDFAKVVYSVGV